MLFSIKKGKTSAKFLIYIHIISVFFCRGSTRIKSDSDHGCKNVLKGRNMNSPGLSEAQPRDSRCPQPTSRGGNVELVIMGSRGMHGKALVSTITAWTRCDSGPVRGSAGSRTQRIRPAFRVLVVFCHLFNSATEGRIKISE